MLKLVISDNEGTTTVVPFVRDEISIGRKDGNTIRLIERNISRKHCTLERVNGAYKVRDHGSYNGVIVNGARIEREADLSFVGLRRSQAWLERWLENPRAWKHDARMPRLRLRPRSRQALVLYLAGLQGRDYLAAGRPWAALMGTPADTARWLERTPATDALRPVRFEAFLLLGRIDEARAGIRAPVALRAAMMRAALAARRNSQCLNRAPRRRGSLFRGRRSSGHASILRTASALVSIHNQTID